MYLIEKQWNACSSMGLKICLSPMALWFNWHPFSIREQFTWNDGTIRVSSFMRESEAAWDHRMANFAELYRQAMTSLRLPEQVPVFNYSLDPLPSIYLQNGPNSADGLFAASTVKDASSAGPQALAAGSSRHLTAGEIAMARGVFGDTVDYDKVLIYNKKHNMLQPKDTAVTPNGNMYFNPKGSLYRDDFSADNDVVMRGLFIHEMVHVWQHQSGVNVLARGLTERNYAYLPLVTGKAFGAYNIEQQGDIVMDYYYLTQGYRTQGAPNIDVYQKLIPFLPK